MPHPPFAGGCQCGHVRFEVTQEPYTAYVCHCTMCQRQSASAFAISVRMARSAFRLVSGELSGFQAQSDSGRIKLCRFCPRCGVRVYHQYDESDEVVTLKAGTLDDPSWIVPAGHIWFSSACAWVRDLVQSGEDTLIYARHPETADALAERWRALRGLP